MLLKNPINCCYNSIYYCVLLGKCYNKDKDKDNNKYMFINCNIPFKLLKQ